MCIHTGNCKCISFDFSVTNFPIECYFLRKSLYLLLIFWSSFCCPYSISFLQEHFWNFFCCVSLFFALFSHFLGRFFLVLCLWSAWGPTHRGTEFWFWDLLLSLLPLWPAPLPEGAVFRLWLFFWSFLSFFLHKFIIYWIRYAPKQSFRKVLKMHHGKIRVRHWE